MAVRGKGAAQAAPFADTAGMQLHVVADASGRGGKKTARYRPQL